MSDPNAPYRGAPWLTNRDAEIAGEIMQRQGPPAPPRPPDPRKQRRRRRRAWIRAGILGVIGGLLAVNTLYDALTHQAVRYSLLFTAVFCGLAWHQGSSAASMPAPPKP
jgi:hypothetical protein